MLVSEVLKYCLLDILFENCSSDWMRIEREISRKRWAGREEEGWLQRRRRKKEGMRDMATHPNERREMTWLWKQTSVSSGISNFHLLRFLWRTLNVVFISIVLLCVSWYLFHNIIMSDQESFKFYKTWCSTQQTRDVCYGQPLYVSK